jgi:hypothetical protein
LWLCFEAKAGAAKTSKSRTAARIFFMEKMYHESGAGGRVPLAQHQKRNDVLAEAKTG